MSRTCFRGLGPVGTVRYDSRHECTQGTRPGHGPSVTDALLQVGLLIGLGFVLRRSRFLEPGFWRSFERMVYFVLLPTLVFQVLADATIDSSVAARLSAAVALSILLLALVLVLVRRAIGLTGPAFTSVFQGSVRFNSYVALAVIPAVFGKGGLELLAVLIAVVVPLVNVLSVLMLAVFAGGPSPTPWRVVRSIAGNPLIVASVLGILANATLHGLPGTLDGALGVLARAALPSGLMAVGAALVPGEFRDHARGLSVSLVARFAVLPVVSFGVGSLLHLPAEALGVLVLFQAQPTATSAYLLARQLGGDAELMASIITGQTLLAFAVLPVVVALVPG